MTTVTLEALAERQGRHDRQIAALTAALRKERAARHELAQRYEALRLVVDFTATAGEPQTDYERAAAAQADKRADDEARRRIIYAVSSQQQEVG